MLGIKGRSPEELIIMVMASICLIGQVPYGLFRLANGDWLIAGIDLFGAVLCATAIYQVYRHRRVWLFGAAMSIAAVIGVLMIIASRGVQEVQFLYPVLVMSYFLLKPSKALALSLGAIACLAFILFAQIEIFFLSKIMLSLLGCTMFAFCFSTLRNEQANKLERLSTKDALTGVYNRRSLDDRLQQFVLQQKRQSARAALIILDLDNFKQVNDHYGHGAGDQVLKRVADTISKRIRATDQLYRYGGDEFVVFVNDASLQQTLGLAEDLRARVEATEAMEGTNVSISLGVAVYKPEQTPTEWLDSADVGLLSAKSAGRNQVVSHAAG